MLISCKNKILFAILLSILQVNNSHAETLSFNKANSYLLNKYENVYKDFTRQLCRPGTEEKFDKLNTAFRGTGNYIPILPDGKLDKKTIQQHLPLFKKKEKWILNNINRLKKKKNFREELIEIKQFRDQLNVILEFKRQYFENEQLLERDQAREKSKLEYNILKDKFLSFLYRRDYLLAFQYPIDHYQLRSEYDKYKDSEKNSEKQLSNSTYFYRKIVEDGAQDPDHSRTDLYVRANLNTLILKLRRPSEIISENIRYDMEDVLEKLEFGFQRGVKQQIKRNQEWLERVQHSEKFYQDLLKNKVKVGNHFETGLQLVKNRSEALINLKNFILDKQAQSYKFWMNQDPLLRQIFAIETILFNEVGRVDVKDALERKDVTQVVINRTSLAEYSQFDKEDALYKVLTGKEKITDDLLSQNPWLNVLFKEGEFSFTYFFISGSVRVFCADATYAGRSLRKENIFIALNMLKNPNPEFKAVRYYSRASMLGRIDMARLWTDFYALPERPGSKVQNSHSYLLKQIQNGKYRYLYNFRSDDQQFYEVLDIEKRTYVYLPSKKRLFHYRNPHFFTYFTSSSN